MKKRPLYLAFIWHMHQPCYKDPTKNEYLLPWVRLHGIKDYYEMAAILEEFPQIHLTFNLVPSLLIQINDYIYGQAKDFHLRLSHTSVKELSPEDKRLLLDTFFMGNFDTMINPYPRYRELFNKYNQKEAFSEQDFLDLQVWSNLSWFAHSLKERDGFIHSLILKGRNFKEEEKKKLLNKAKWILLKVIPAYKKLQDRGQIEISTSPYYHPILPLLIDPTCAKEIEPEITLPQNLLSAKDDAKEQIRLAVRFYKRHFDQIPRGMWPPEGAVSNEIIPLMAKEGIRWLAADEGVLSKSLKRKLVDKDLYQPYRLEIEGYSLLIVFRDRTLSNLINFSYSKWSPIDAVRDFINRLHQIHNRLDQDQDHLVSVILDGENLWEYYQNNGYDFLSLLYDTLSHDDLIKTVTISEYLQDHPSGEVIRNLSPGSWTGQGFRTWIGEKEDNLAWDYLYEAREALLKFEDIHKGDKSFGELIKKAWNQIFIAEGSDWFWWYGSEHSSREDEVFDTLFRMHLASVYRLIGETPPDYLLSPIKTTKGGGYHPTMHQKK